MMPEVPHILYIDDDVGLGRLVTRSLGRAGLEVEHVTSGADGLALLDSRPFDAVALDHHLPGELGLEVLECIRARPDAPPVIYVTGSDDSRVAVAALKAGAADYVWKDVQGDVFELLTQAIVSTLERTRLRRAEEAAQQEVRDARDRAELMLVEVNHRVANSLALVAGFAHMQAACVSDPEAKAALAEMETRIHAIAGVHRRLYTSSNVLEVELDAYIKSLAAELERSLRSAGRNHPLKVETDSISVPPDKAVSLGVLVTELVTNAYKYAYPLGAQGDIRVRLRRSQPQSRIIIEDDGAGWQGEGPAQGTGLGARIVKAMAANLGSSATYDPDFAGTRVSISF